MRRLKVLVVCEETQAITVAFRRLGHIAFSCDLRECSGPLPQYHIKGDALKLLDMEWDILIGNPPCTHTACSAVTWLHHPADRKLPFGQRRPHPRYPERRKAFVNDIEFFKSIYNSKTKYVGLENPRSLISTYFMAPTQVIHPWQHGDAFEKRTYLWLKNLPIITPTYIVHKGSRTTFSSGKSMPKWMSDAKNKHAHNKDEVQRLRSVTFPGIAEAMAVQWSKYVLEND